MSDKITDEMDSAKLAAFVRGHRFYCTAHDGRFEQVVAKLESMSQAHPTDEEGVGWRTPYRSQDESGSRDAAGTVGFHWLQQVLEAERGDNPTLLEMQRRPLHGGGSVGCVYRGSKLLAVATVFRDCLNFSVLVRWLSPDAALNAIRGK